MAYRGKMRQIEDVKRSKIVVEIGVFYYRCPFVTLGDLECRWFESGRQTIPEISTNTDLYLHPTILPSYFPPTKKSAHRHYGDERCSVSSSFGCSCCVICCFPASSSLTYPPFK